VSAVSVKRVNFKQLVAALSRSPVSKGIVMPRRVETDNERRARV